jgi:hypothetical protein
MPKRDLETEDAAESTNKRQRVESRPGDRLSRLSDELILRVLAFLTVTELNICQR